MHADIFFCTVNDNTDGMHSLLTWSIEYLHRVDQQHLPVVRTKKHGKWKGCWDFLNFSIFSVFNEFIAKSPQHNQK